MVKQSGLLGLLGSRVLRSGVFGSGLGVGAPGISVLGISMLGISALRCQPGVTPRSPAASNDRAAGQSTSGQFAPRDAEVQRVTRQATGRFRLCYADSLEDDYELRGRVVVRLTLGASGRVEAAEVDEATDVEDANMLACLLDVYRTLRFAPPSESPEIVFDQIDFETW